MESYDRINQFLNLVEYIETKHQKKMLCLIGSLAKWCDQRYIFYNYEQHSPTK